MAKLAREGAMRLRCSNVEQARFVRAGVCGSTEGARGTSREPVI